MTLLSPTSLFSQAVGSLILKASYTLVSLATLAVLARLLGPGDFGIYTFYLTVVNMLAVPAMIGAPPLFLRQVPAYVVGQQWQLLRGLLQRTGLLALGIAGGLGGGVIFCSSLAAVSSPAAGAAALWLALTVLPALALLQIYGAALRGMHHVLLGQVPEQLLRPLFFLLTMGLIVWQQQQLTLVTAFGLQVLATWTALFIALWCLWRRLPQPVKTGPAHYDTIGWLKIAGPVTLATGLNLFNKEASIFFLGWLQSSEAVGIYRVAQRGSELIMFGLLAVNAVIAPKLANSYARRDWPALQATITHGSRLVILYALPVAVFLIALGPVLLPLVFGVGFSASYVSLVVLALGQLFNAAVGGVGLILNMLHQERQTLRGLCCGTAASLVLHLLLVPLWGVTGAALASSLSLVVWNLLLAVAIYRLFGLSTTAIAWNRTYGPPAD